MSEMDILVKVLSLGLMVINLHCMFGVKREPDALQE